MSRGGSGGPPTYVFIDADDTATDRPLLSRGLVSGWDQGPAGQDLSRQGSSQRSRSDRRTARQLYTEAAALFDMETDWSPADLSDDDRTESASSARFFFPRYLSRSRYMQRLKQQHERRVHVEQQEREHFQQAASEAAAAAVRPRLSEVDSVRPLSPSESARRCSVQRGVAQRVVERHVHSSNPADDDRLDPLPLRWSSQDQASGLKLSADGSRVRWRGHFRSPDEAASLRTDNPIPKDVGLYYYEVEVKSKGKEALIGVGLSRKTVSLTRQPGWEPDSYAYHGDDGLAYGGSANGNDYGPRFSAGDVIGCGINFRTNTIFFTKNGVFLGDAFRNVKTDRLYPTVGLKKLGEYLKLNLGREQFVFDIEGMMEQERATVRAAVNAQDVSTLHPPDDEGTVIQKLIGQFLAHEGYVEASRAFAKDLQDRLDLAPSANGNAVHFHDDADDVHAVQRQKIRMAILEGDIDRALKYTRIHYPRVLEDKQNRDVYFRLRCRKFIEMMRDYSEYGSSSYRLESSDQSLSNGHGTQDHSMMSNTQMELDDQLQREASNGVDTTHAIPLEDVDMDGSNEMLSKKRSYTSPSDLQDAAIQYGRSLHADFDSDSRANVQEELQNIFALMAYADPRDSPVGELLNTDRRASIAEDLNGAILVSLGKPSSTALEKLCSQTSTLLDLATKVGGAAAFVDNWQDNLDTTGAVLRR